MATIYWRGFAIPVAQVDTLTVGGTVEAGDIFNVICNGKTLSVSATTTVLATTAQDIVTAFNNSTVPEFAEITAAVTSGGALTLTADTPGRPFTITVSTTESNLGAADAQTFGTAATTANAGPNNWDTASNWSGGAVPVGADDVIIEAATSDILYGLAQSAVTLTSLTIKASYTGKIGLPKVNAEGSGSYFEYRADYLAISATTCTIGEGPGNGSPRIKINFGTVQTAVTVFNSASGAETGLGALILKGTHASNTISVFKGSVSVAPFASEVATFLTILQGFVTNRAGDSWMHFSSGCTLGTLTQDGGYMQTDAAIVTLLTIRDGVHEHKAGAMASLVLLAGTCYYGGTGTITVAQVGSGAGVGILDFSKDMRARTVTAIDIYKGSEIRDPAATVTWTAGIDVNRCKLSDVKIDCGSHRRWTPGTVA